MTPFQSKVEILPSGPAVVVLSGPLDASCVTTLRQEINRLKMQRPERIVIDMEQVTLMTKDPIGLFVAVTRTTPCPIIFCAFKESILSHLLVMQLDTVWNIVTTRALALSGSFQCYVGP